jgi:hypothetical protein
MQGFLALVERFLGGFRAFLAMLVVAAAIVLVTFFGLLVLAQFLRIMLL